ncbi:MAG: hypothetical protein FWH18_04865 [Marinilabiliaceae bacterium]|nr:hypothetical protein [Marinilabiliaceae bacterium]
MKQIKIIILICCFCLTAVCCNNSNNEPEPINEPDPTDICEFVNPTTDLIWLKEIVEEIVLIAESGNPISVSIFQCIYGNNETGFLIDKGNINPFHNCKGEVLCIMGGNVGDTCSELNIVSQEQIWEIENGFINGLCEFDNPLEDLRWLKKIVEEFTEYSNSIDKGHFKIYQCSYIEESRERVGFVITPICVDCPDDTAMLYRCTGFKLCSMGDIIGTCDEFNITNKILLWEINN